MSDAPRKRNFFSLPVVLGLGALALFGIWSVYWFYGAGVVQQGAREWIEEQELMGRRVDYSGLSVSGYPYRFVLQADDPSIDAPDLNARWEADTLQMITMAWNLNHVIVRSPGQTELILPDGQTLSLTPGDSASASFVWEEGNLRRIGVDLPTLTAVLNGTQRFDLTNGSVGLRPMPDAPRDLQLAVSAEDIRLPFPPDGAEWLGSEAAELVIWGQIQNFYDLVESGLSLTEWKLDENRIELVRGDLDMGPLDISMRANVKLDRDNNPDGTVSVFLQRSQDLIDALNESGNLEPGLMAAINTIAATSQQGTPFTVQVKERQIRLLGQTLAEY